MIILRRGNNVEKFKEIQDAKINSGYFVQGRNNEKLMFTSGVGPQKALIQFIFWDNEILDATANIANANKLLQLASTAFTTNPWYPSPPLLPCQHT